MHSNFLSSFADELTKVAAAAPVEGLLAKVLGIGEKAGLGRAAKKVVQGIKDIPANRNPILRSAALGSVVGGAEGLGGDTSGKRESSLMRTLRGARSGAIGGAVTGAIMPGWFRHH